MVEPLLNRDLPLAAFQTEENEPGFTLFQVNNLLDELLDGVSLTARRSEPGTRVNVNIIHDIDATYESIKSFIDNRRSKK